MEAKEAFRSASCAGVVTSANPSRFPDENSKILYASSLMRGPAFVWLQPFVEKSSVYPSLQDFEKFSDAILNQFGDKDAEADTERNIYLLKQKSSVSSYVADFKSLSARLKCNDAADRAQFYRGLKDNIKDELCKSDRPSSLKSLIDLCIKLDNRLHERKLEKGLLLFSPAPAIKQRDPNAMELDSVFSTPRRRLSEEEKLRRRRLNYVSIVEVPNILLKNVLFPSLETMGL